jgi:protoheme IX farnesyltransferase
MALLWFYTNPVAAAVTLAGFFIYVAVYTAAMKRISVHSALVGSLSGAAPPVAGYIAVSGQFDMAALLLLVIFCLWQMPHWYAIAIFRKDDYAAASIPVLPALRGMDVTRRHIALYIAAFVFSACMLTFFGYTGLPTLAVMAALGAWWMRTALSGYMPDNERKWAKKVFGLSILNIIALSVMIALDHGGF